ncbi:MAG TPA: RsmE family RNA methyltransferase [Candidatus Acidoferrales bacterium]|nr:RsmE family RNA methyltransferase [Candidatus Acidoferrales bacterium]
MEQYIFETRNRARNPDGDDIITMIGDEHFHLSRVLRARAGETILATDGEGTTCLCVIQQIGKVSSICKVIEEHRNFNLSAREFYIGIAALKPVSKLELAVEKCTELGSRGFLLFNSERSEKVNLRRERMAAIVKAAVKQSLQSKIPELAIVRNLEEAASQCHVHREKFVLHEKSDKMMTEYLPEVKKGRSVIVLVGPEGGFSEKEIGFLTENGFKSFSLGKSRLRSETAAIKAASLLAVY